MILRTAPSLSITMGWIEPPMSGNSALQTSPPIACRDRLRHVLPNLVAGEQHCIQGDRVVAIRHDGLKPDTIARAHVYANVSNLLTSPRPALRPMALKSQIEPSI